MTSTNQTSWTNNALDLLRSNPHIDCKPILKQVVRKTLEGGILFVSPQSRATERQRHVRLDAWYYIRCVGVDEVSKAVRDSACSYEELRNQIRDSMDDQKFYHVVIRGNDPDFTLLGGPDGQDIVANYCCGWLDLIHEEVDKFLFYEISDPQAIQQAMSDPLFDAMLEHYFRGGDTDREETLHVVSRFHGGGNLLHTCIKEGYLPSLQLLLGRYTLECHGDATRWRVLAEPLRGCGKHKVSAFHRAVYDVQPECLKELVSLFQRHGHDITELRNVEERTSVGAMSRNGPALVGL